MRIDSSGNVGIGTSNPSAPLDVTSSTLGYMNLTGGSSNAQGSFIRFRKSTTDIGFIGTSSAVLGNSTSDFLMYADGAANAVFSTNGTERMRIDSSGNVDIGGTSPSQTFTIASSASGTGMGFGESTGNYGNIWTTYSSGDFALAAGLQGSKTAEAFTSSYGGGSMYRSAIKLGAFNNVGIQFFTDTASTVARGTVITPTERMRIDSSGNVLINRTTVAGAGNVGLIISGDTDTTDTNYTFYTVYSNGTQVFGLKNSGYVRADGIYNKTSATAANVNVDSGGSLTRATSALKYKTDVRNLESIDINKFRPVRYKSKCEIDDPTLDHFGVIADEVDQAGIKELVTYGATGEVEGFQYERLTVVLLKAMQEQQALIEQLTARLNALEGK
jgi:hypothetical protein